MPILLVMEMRLITSLHMPCLAHWRRKMWVCWVVKNQSLDHFKRWSMWSKWDALGKTSETLLKARRGFTNVVGPCLNEARHWRLSWTRHMTVEGSEQSGADAHSSTPLARLRGIVNQQIVNVWSRRSFEQLFRRPTVHSSVLTFSWAAIKSTRYCWF